MAYRSINRYRRAGSKYNSLKVQRDGQTFDSVKEWRRWVYLKGKEEDGEIAGLQRQVKFELIPTQREPSEEVYTRGQKKGQPKPGKVLEESVSYYADFVYFDSSGEMHVEDTKGVKTKDYVIKRKLMLYKYKIMIEEV